MSFKQGVYKPKRPDKYRGDPTNIVYRSSWEFRFMRYCDMHDGIIQWSSEEMFVPYKSPVDGRTHRYFPDFIIKTKTSTIMIEVKPYGQTQPPEKKEKATKRYIREVMTYGVNQAKWDAAKQYCKKKGWQFKILTEKELPV